MLFNYSLRVSIRKRNWMVTRTRAYYKWSYGLGLIVIETTSQVILTDLVGKLLHMPKLYVVRGIMNLQNIITIMHPSLWEYTFYTLSLTVSLCLSVCLSLSICLSLSLSLFLSVSLCLSLPIYVLVVWKWSILWYMGQW